MAWVSLAQSLGCGPEGASDAGPDGSADSGADGGVDAADLVTPPDIPWLAEGVPPIMLAPCPEGWREVHGGAVTECDPYPEGGAEVCDEGEAHFPGEPGCRPIGEACPPGDYGTSVPTSGSVIYVNAGAPGAGDGSLGAPFSALSQVPWGTLAAGTTVALAKGTYPGVLRLEAGVRVMGACARDTVVTGLGPSEATAAATVTSTGEAAAVENLSVRGALHFGVVVERGRRLNLRGVVIERVQGVGVYMSGAGAEVSLADVVIRDTLSVGPLFSESGLGVYADLGAQLDGLRLVVEGNRQFGVYARQGAQVSLADAVVRDTRPQTSGMVDGLGIVMTAGAQLEAARVLVSENHDIGIVVEDTGSAAMLTDAIVRGTRVAVTGGLGQGVVVRRGAGLSATRLLVADNDASGLLVDGEGTQAELTDVVIRDPAPWASGRAVGRGMGVQNGARLDATRLLVSGASEVAALVAAVGSAMSVRDALFQRTAANPSTGGAGRGVAVQEGARFEASRLLIADNRDFGIFVSHAGTVVDLADTVIRDTRPQASDLQFGRGIHGQYDVHIEGRRVEVEGSVGLGVGAVGGASLILSDVTVRGVVISACAATTCPRDLFGYGAGAYGGTLSLTRFQVVDAAICGVIVSPQLGTAESGSVDLEAGVVAGAEIGACVQVDGYDLGRLTTDVVYRDNGTNLDITTLPVPGVVGALEE